MSDPVTNSQVEDVLSSIRRLVGDNKRPAATDQAGPDRLVLTPQLRVASPDVLQLESKDAVLPSDEWYEFEEPPLNDVSSFGDMVSDEEAIDDAELTLSFSHHVNPMSDLHEYDAETDEEAFPDSQEAAPASTMQTQTSSQLSDKIAALENAIARTKDQWEPEGDEDDAYAGTRSPAMRWQSNVELDGRGTPLRIPSIEVPSQPASQDNEEQVIDEDTLRDLVVDIVREELKGTLVAQIVREELQGDLGERITRNVRKMVRREIQRAMTARELD